jgi:L-galactono-1,4-lactone dehydrogenase
MIAAASRRKMASSRLLTGMMRVAKGLNLSKAVRMQQQQRQFAVLSKLNDANNITTKATMAAAMLACAGSLALFDKNTTKLEFAPLPAVSDDAGDEEETTDVINWSGTHKVKVANKHYYEPENVQEVEEIVKRCHANGQTVRPIGSSLSPNGIALNKDGMISMANVDQVLEIDTVSNTITVEAGIPVSKVVDALRPYNLTLPNLASIAEQQMGGFIQVGAHGTGKKVAPVDHYVTKIKMVTPNQGTVELSKQTHGRLFEMARVGLGCLGVVVEITMECIPAHNLVEHTFVLTRDQAIQQKDELLEKHKHMRFMWIPYTDAVVVVTNDPSDQVSEDIPRNQTAPGSQKEKDSPLTDLLKELCAQHNKPFSEEDVKGMGFGEIRDALLAFDPLSVKHVKRCNRAEAEFWSKNEGYQTKPSDQLLQFDCGGQVRFLSSRF